MPGLVGIINTTAEHRVDPSLLHQMSRALSHRLWHKQDVYTSPTADIAIARVHLSIINPAPQPYVGHNGRIRVFLDGEIYNDDADEHDQLGFVYRAYERYGLDFARRLNGSFVAIIVDEIESIVIIANDRIASRPLLSFFDGHALYFAPELKALLPIPSLRKTLNWSAVASFLSCGYFLNGDTLIEDITPLDNATVLTISRRGTSTAKYWNPVFDEQGPDLGSTHYHEALSHLIRQAVQRRTRTPLTYGILLSGGYDSRGILGCYLETKHNEPINTISWGSAEDIPHTDCAIARRVATKLGTKHTFYRLRPEAFIRHVRDFVYLSDGMTDACSNYPESLQIFRQIREDLGIQVILRGDEWLGWISVFDDASMFQTLGVTALHAYRGVLTEDSHRLLEQRLQESLSEISSRCSSTHINNRKGFFYLDQQIKHYLNPLNYIKTVEVESRTPFMDNDLLDFVPTLPGKYTRDKRLYRSVVTRMFPALFDEFALRPDSINWGRAFSQSASLRGFIHKTLIEPRASFGSLIDRQGLERLLTSCAQSRGEDRLKSAVIRLLGRYPELYLTAKDLYKAALRKTDSGADPVSRTTLIFRLLTLRIWEEFFLNETTAPAFAREG